MPGLGENWNPGEGLKALELAFTRLPLSFHQPASRRAFLWFPGATWRSAAGGPLAQDLKYRLLMLSQRYPDRIEEKGLIEQL